MTSIATWGVPIVSALISIGGSYLVSKNTADSAVEVAKTEAAASIAAAKQAADASIEAAKQAAKASDVEMARLALTVINDPTASSTFRGWALRLLAEATETPISASEILSIVSKIENLPTDPNNPFGWSRVDDPKLQEIFGGIKNNVDDIFGQYSNQIK